MAQRIEYKDKYLMGHSDRWVSLGIMLGHSISQHVSASHSIWNLVPPDYGLIFLNNLQT